MRATITIILFLFFPSFFFAQSFQPHSINYSVEDGVPSSECYEVMQDSKGLIWIATDKGICKFNGYTFTKYTTEDGLPDNTVFGFFEDSKKRIWGRTLSGGLFYFENDSIHIPRFNESLKKEVGQCIINDFYITDNDSIYVETREYRTFKMYFNSKNATVIAPSQSTMKIFNKKVITFWDPHSSERFKNNDILKIQIPYKKKLIAYEIKRTGNGVPGQKMVLRKDGFLISYGEYLSYYEESTSSFLNIEYKNRVLSVFEEKNNRIWVGTLNGGVYYYPYGIHHPSKHFFENESITSLFEDNEGGIWLSTLKSGVYYIPNKNNLSIEFAREAFNVIKPFGDEMAGGSKNGNVYFFDSSGISNMASLPESITKGNLIYDLYDAGNSMLAGGLLSFSVNKKDHKATSFLIGTGTYTRGFAPNPTKDMLYIFSHSEVEKVSAKNTTLIEEIMATERIISIHCTGDNHLFIGTVNGLYTLLNGKFTQLKNDNKLLQNRINDIASFGHKLVLATNGAGVLLLDLENNSIKQVSEADGLSSNICQRIFIDHTSAWIATNKGVSVLRLNNDGFESDISNVDQHDGLPGEEVNNIWVDDKNVWIASNSGISYLNKNLDFKNKVQPKIYLDFLKTNKSIYPDPGKKLVFNYDENYVEINFYGISFKSFKNIKYKYKLSGADEAWHYTSDPKIIYPALSPGQYRFEVFALNNDNISSEHSAILYFDVIPPFWQRWWFRLFCGLIIIFIVFQLFRYRINFVKEREIRNSELNKTLLSLKLKALRAQMNPHFTFNVLNSIQHFMLYKDEKSAQRYLSKFSRLIRTILNNSEDNTIPLAEEIKALELYLELEAMRFENSFEYEISIDKTINTSAVQIPSMLIQPYVENAIKHGILPLKENGRIRIELIRENLFLKCIVEDNGIGRKKAGEQDNNALHTSLGTSLTRERLNVINSLNNNHLSETITDLTDGEGNACGTRVEIFIPIT